MSYTNLLYHIVYGTKWRLPIISDKYKPRLHEYLGGVIRGIGGTAFEINGMEDHVHILAKIRPTVSISEFMRELKSNTSLWAKNNLTEKFAWQRRYGAFTVSESQFEIVRNYIRNQEAHHQKFDFKQEFEALLRAHKIEIDRFLWND